MHTLFLSSSLSKKEVLSHHAELKPIMQLSGSLCLTCCKTLVWLTLHPTVKMVKWCYVIFCLLIFFNHSNNKELRIFYLAGQEIVLFISRVNWLWTV